VAINDFLNRIDETLKREKQFTADASHQLRTPLSVMKGNLQVLLRKKRSETEYIEEIQKAVFKIDDMTDAVEKLLILARLNTSNRKLNFETIELYPFIEQIFKNYKKSILSKGLSLQVDGQLKGKTVYTKRRFLQLILDNLISNAIKYSSTNSKIYINAKQSESTLEVTIQNDGPVISPEDLNDIFIPFFRNSAHNHTEKGFGLGLAIVKKVSEALDIKVSVYSRDDTTRFSLTFQT
jgi:signal transduction histidine kinase